MASEYEDEPLFDPRALTVKELVIRLDGKLTSGLSILTEGHATLSAGHTDHETRIRALEARSYISPKGLFTGAISIMAGAAGLTTTVIAIVTHIHIS